MTSILCSLFHRRLAETKGECIRGTFVQLAADLDISNPLGLDYLDREKAKRQAVEQAHHLANERYGHGHNGVNYLRQNGGYGNDYNPGYGGGYNRPPGYGPPQGEYGGGYGGAPGGGYGGPPGGGYGGPPGGGYGGPQGGYGGGRHIMILTRVGHVLSMTVNRL